MGSAVEGHKKSLELIKPQEVFAEGTQGKQELPGVPGPCVVWERPRVHLSHVVAAVLWQGAVVLVSQRHMKLSGSSTG